MILCSSGVMEELAIGSGSDWRTRASNSVEFLPRKGKEPVAIWYSTTPNEKMSER